MEDLNLESLSSLLDSQFSSFFDSKLENQTETLMKTIGSEINDEVSKVLDPTLVMIDSLAKRLECLEKRLPGKGKGEVSSKPVAGGGNSSKQRREGPEDQNTSVSSEDVGFLESAKKLQLPPAFPSLENQQLN